MVQLRQLKSGEIFAGVKEAAERPLRTIELKNDLTKSFQLRYELFGTAFLYGSSWL
jgi:hypothetical protein